MKTKLTWFDRIMAAVAFAEANEQDAGREFLSGAKHSCAKQQKREECDGVLASDLQGAEIQS